MTEWVSRRLADACASIDYGFTASANSAPVGPKFLRITDIVGDALRWESVPYVKGDIRALERYRLAHGDIVIARTGATTGESCFIQKPPDAVFASYLVRLKIKQSFSPRFIAYWLKSPQFRNYLAGVLGDKSAQPNASASTMTNAPITLPLDRDYQHTIASILGVLDDKIELNRRMNETLEAMARAIFKDWFVDFGPTRAKMDGSAPYLAPDLWSVFPETIDQHGKPTGWNGEAVYEQAIWVNGAAYKDMHFSSEPDALPVVKIAELKSGITKTTRFTNTDLGERYKIRDGELLFSWSGNPDTSIDTFIWTSGTAWLNQHIFAVRPNGKRSQAFLYAMLKFLRSDFAEIARNKQTTGLGHVTQQDLIRLKRLSRNGYGMIL